MLEILLGLVSIANVGLEACAAKASVENEGSSLNKFIPASEPTKEEKERMERRRLLEEADKAYKTESLSVCRRNMKIYSRAEVVANADDSSKEIDTLANWIMKHDDILINVLEPGHHLISYKDLGGVDKEELADFLFKQPTIESVEQVKEGIEVISR